MFLEPVGSGHSQDSCRLPLAVAGRQHEGYPGPRLRLRPCGPGVPGVPLTTSFSAEVAQHGAGRPEKSSLVLCLLFLCPVVRHLSCYYWEASDEGTSWESS